MVFCSCLLFVLLSLTSTVCLLVVFLDIQGETVRQAKVDKKPKEALDAEVEKLKSLKSELEKLVSFFASCFLCVVSFQKYFIPSICSNWPKRRRTTPLIVLRWRMCSPGGSL